MSWLVKWHNHFYPKDWAGTPILWARLDTQAANPAAAATDTTACTKGGIRAPYRGPSGRLIKPAPAFVAIMRLTLKSALCVRRIEYDQIEKVVFNRALTG
ncbi:MAG: hypothetical protein FRX49_11792 [Trebouxia sp. A1-2]|nr:MAG: hypothetical protein FRX49_11792 [Trebouxia sp. A1-2]